MKLPLILQLRRKISTRRQSALFDRHPGLIFLTALAWPLLALASLGTYRGTQQYVAGGLPVLPLFLAVVIAWVGIGLDRQLRLNRDRHWNIFVSHMPVRPIHLLAVNVYVGMAVGMVGAILLISGLCGAGTELWTKGAIIRWLLIGVTFIWVLSLQVFLGLVSSRFAWGNRLLLLALAFWGALILARFAWGPRSEDLYVDHITDICLTDPVLVASGMRRRRR